jgi:Flp pilus assembly protein TadB
VLRSRPRPGLIDRVAANDLLRLRVGAGFPPEDLAGLSPRAIRSIAVATRVGAPLGAAVDGAAAAEDDAERARRAVHVAGAQTRAVAAGLLLAPVLLVPGLGRLVGADLVGFYRSSLGLVVLLAGGGLLAVGGLLVGLLIRRVGQAGRAGRSGQRLAPLLGLLVALSVWRVLGAALAPLAALVTFQLVRRNVHAGPTATGVDEAADLTATALAGGVSTPEALRTVAEELPQLTPELLQLAFELELGLSGSCRPPEPALADLERLRAVLRTAEQLGAPVAPALRRLAGELRADELARVLAAAERLPAQLTFPTALFLLPGTVLLIGAPIVHAGLAAAST